MKKLDDYLFVLGLLFIVTISTIWLVKFISVNPILY